MATLSGMATLKCQDCGAEYGTSRGLTVHRTRMHPPERLVGAPSKLTDELTDTICEHLGDGQSIATACALAGIATTTYYDWLKDVPKFADKATRARAEAQADAVRAWRKGWGSEEQGDWRAAKEFAARREPGEFGETTKHEHTGRDGGPIAMTWADLVSSAQGE